VLSVCLHIILPASYIGLITFLSADILCNLSMVLSLGIVHTGSIMMSYLCVCRLGN